MRSLVLGCCIGEVAGQGQAEMPLRVPWMSRAAAVCTYSGTGKVPGAGLSVTSRARGRLLANPSAPAPLPRSQRSGEGDINFLINTH